LLGVYEDAEFSTTRAGTRPGDRLLLYTDGVTDAPGRSERFGEERLVEALRTLDPDATEIAHAVLETVDRFLVKAQPDDIAMISMVRENPAAQPASEAA